MVANQLNAESKIAIIIDTPSANDVIAKKLLTGKEQGIFNAKLAQNNIISSQCSILSVISERHTQPEYCNQKELTCWTELLRRNLAKINPNVIIAVGEVVLQALTDYVAVDKYRGSPLPCKLKDNVIVLPVEHYKEYYGSPAWQPLTDFYLQKAYSYRDLTELPWRPLEVIITKDIALLEREFLSADYINNPESVLAIDIECSYSEMTCIGFAKDENTAYVIPLVHAVSTELAGLLKLIDRIQRSPVKKILQNGNFDITYQGYYYGIKVNNFYWDCMLCNHSLWPNLPKGLDTVSSIFTDEKFWKDEGKQWKLTYDKVNWKQFFEYNGKDVANLITIQKNQKELLAARGTEATFRQEMDLCYPLITIELQGMAINLEKQGELRQIAELNIHKWELFKSTMLGDLDINTKSPPQLANLLYNKLKFPKRIKDGKITTNIDAMISLIPLDPILIKSIIILNDWKKEYSSYKVKLGPDGRTRTTFKPAGTATGRLASSKSITGTGDNLQTVTKKLRVFYEPDPGHLLLQADYSKAESWIVAALAEDEKMLAALFGEDFHSTNASNILGKIVTKANYSDRQLGKRIGHGASYGMTAFLLQKVLLKDGYSFSQAETQALLDMFFMNYPKVQTNFHAWIRQQLSTNMTLENPFGRKITFWQHWGTKLFNAAYAWIPQGTVGDMTNKALINISNNIPEVDLRLQVHDSLVMQIKPEDLNQQLINRITEQMVMPITIKNTTVNIPIDIELGPNWHDLQDWAKVKNDLSTFLSGTCNL